MKKIFDKFMDVLFWGACAVVLPTTTFFEYLTKYSARLWKNACQKERIVEMGKRIKALEAQVASLRSDCENYKDKNEELEDEVYRLSNTNMHLVAKYGHLESVADVNNLMKEQLGHTHRVHGEKK